MSKIEPNFIYTQNRDFWHGNSKTIYHEKEVISNLLGVEPDRAGIMSASIGTLVIGFILIVLASALYSEFLFVVTRFESLGFENTIGRIMYQGILWIGFLLLLRLFFIFFMVSELI